MRASASTSVDPMLSRAMAFAMRAAVLLFPAMLLLVAFTRASGNSQTILGLGVGFQVIVCCLAFLSNQSWSKPVAPSVISLYLIALGWLWIGSLDRRDWYTHLAQAILLIVPLSVFGVQTLVNTGAPTMRRARYLAQRLANRKDWPADLAACRELPEVKAFREALHLDAAPALELLKHKAMHVRLAALAALEFRKNWRNGQPEIVLQAAHKAVEPAERAAAVIALANLDDRAQVEMLASFLQDPSPAVRQATYEALLWDSEKRWPWIRHAVRQSLSNPNQEMDGALLCRGQTLPPEAIADLKAWSCEKSLLGTRAAVNLALYYGRVLNDHTDELVLEELHKQVINPQAPALLRMEFAQVLRNCGRWEGEMLENLLSPSHPSGLRLLAAESLLAKGRHAPAESTLCDLAQLPNRAIAVATARAVQKCLGVDLGLAHEQPDPAVHTKAAADVTRRVMNWAAQIQKGKRHHENTTSVDETATIRPGGSSVYR